MVGLIATPELAQTIKKEIYTFLANNLKLELSLDKSKITDLLHDKAFFLGFYLLIHKPKESEFTRRISHGMNRRVKKSHNRL